MQWQELFKSRKLLETLKRRDQQQESQRNIWGDMECYWRQSEQYCKFKHWGGWGNQGGWWRWQSASQPQRWWRTWLGDGHNPRNGTAPHGKFSREADQAWWITTTGMEGGGRLVPWERYEVWDGPMDDSSSWQASIRHDWSHTITDNIWRAYAESSYRLRTIGNASRDFSSGK